MMKKIMYDRFGNVDVLKLAEVAIFDITNKELLIKVKAVSINPLDWKIREGEMKLMSGSKFPKGAGVDFSSVIEKKGDSVNKFKEGEEVFGTLDIFKGGALAEYIVVSEKNIAIKPGNISFEQAAALSITGSAALQIFDKLVKLKKGSEVLINGATGGIGMFAVQIAKMQGAIVTSVVSKNGIALVEKWKSDFILDYKKTDILQGNKQYDVVIDLSGKIPFNKAKKIMKPSSTYVNTIPGIKEIISSFIHNLFSTQKYQVLLLKPNAKYLKMLSKYASEGLDIVISKTYPITSFKEAYTEVSKGSILGKAVFTI